MKPEAIPVHAPTFQIGRADYYVANLLVDHLDKDNLGELAPEDVLEAVASRLFKTAPDNGIELRSNPTGIHRQVIAEGYVGNEANQPDAVLTFLGAMATERFVVEVVHDQNVWDKIRRRHRIFRSFAFGNPLPNLRKA